MRIYPWTGEFESFTGDLFVPHTEDLFTLLQVKTDLFISSSVLFFSVFMPKFIDVRDVEIRL